MKKIISGLLFGLFFCVAHAYAEKADDGPLLPDNETMLVTVFLKHDQSMNNTDRRKILEGVGFKEMFPPKGIEIVDRYVMMGIGQVIVLRLPPNRLRMLNLAIEHGAWGAYETEFYITYDLLEAQQASGRPR